LIHRLRRLLPEWAAASDAELLGAYACRRDEAAFAAIVRRHGPMVLGLCQRVAGEWHAAEDAFQATFMALARQASTIRRPEALAAWLFGTARRIAGHARAAAVRRAAAALPGAAELVERRPDLLDQITARELMTILDEEVERLPEAHRAAVLLCCFDGKPLDDAARQLGCTLGALRGRLERGRARLHARLARRGVTLAVALGVVEVARSGATAALPGALARVATSAALAFANAPAAPTPISTEAARLAADCLGGTWTRTKLGVALLLAFGLTLGIATVLTTTASTPAQPAPAGALPDPGPAAKAHVDREGEALPPDAVARIGSARLRHPGRLNKVAYAAGGKSIASFDEDGNLCFWDAATGQVQRRLRPAQHPYYGTFAFRRDGKGMVIFDGESCHAIDLESGKKVRSLALEPVDFSVIGSFDATGSLLAIRGMNILKVVDVDSGKERFSIPVDAAPAWLPDAVFSPDGKTVAVSVSTQIVVLIDAATGKQLGKFDAPEWSAGVLAFSPDGKLLFSGSSSSVIWDLKAKKIVGRFKNAALATSAAFSPDGKHVAVGSAGRGIVIAETSGGKEVRRLPGDHAMSLCYSADGRTLLVGGWGGDISQWDVATGRPLDASASPFPGVGRLRFRDERRLLLYTLGFELWDWRAGKRLEEFPELDPPGGDGALQPPWDSWLAQDVSPDGRWLACPTAAGEIVLVDAHKRDAPRRLAGHPGERGAVTARFSPDGRTLFSTGWDNLVRGWDVATGKLVHEWRSHTMLPNVIIVSPDGRWVLSANNYRLWRQEPDVNARLWDVKASRLVRKVAPPPGTYFTTFAFSPDGRLLAAGGGQGEMNAPGHTGRIVVYDVASGERVKDIAGQPRPVTDLAFSPDGRCLAAASFFSALTSEDDPLAEDTSFRYWELATGQVRHRFEGQTGRIQALAFSPSGALLAAASPEAPAYVWDVYGTQTPHVPAAEKWSAETAQAVWKDLGSPDTKAAFQAVRRLVRNSAPAVALCRERLKAAEPLDRKRLTKLLDELDNDDFTARQAAFTEIERLADRFAIEPQLKEALASGVPLEKKRRVQALLEKCAAPGPARLPQERALEVLEQIATPGAVALLEVLAGGEPNAQLTRGAGDALGRLKRRPDATEGMGSHGDGK
jgi:RNA polymerase sigma factor (sigma-70 family)